jgi:hypothetical protein
MRRFGVIFAAVAFASAIGTSGVTGVPTQIGPEPVQTQLKVTATTSLVRCDIQAVKVCWGTCPHDTVEHWEACRDQCYVDNGCV